MSPSSSSSESPRRRRWAARGALAALLALGLAYLRCGAGLGLGGGGGATSQGTEVAPAPPPPPGPAVPRCQLRLDGGGLWILSATGPQQTSVAAAVTACQRTSGADVVVTGEARQGGWDELSRALERGGVPTFVRGAAAAPR